MDNSSGAFTPQEIDEFLNGMNIRFYFCVCLPLLLFIIVFLNLQEKGGISPAFEHGEGVGNYIIAIATVCLWLLGNGLYKHKLSQLPKDLSLKDKLMGFRKASVWKYAVTAGASLLATLLLYITQEQIYLIALGALLTLFSINRPTPYRIIKDLRLDKDERRRLQEYRRYL